MGRTVLAIITVLAATVMTTGAAMTDSAREVDGRFDRPQRDFAPAETVLESGEPADVGVDPAPIDAAARQIAAWTDTTPDREHPMFAGAVSLLVHDGVVIDHRAVGHELRYADGAGTELPADQQEPMAPDTIFDAASITKLFTSIAVLQLVENGAIELDAPAGRYLPEFANNGKESITVRQLLTHTSGLQAVVQLWKLPPEQRIPHVMQLRPENRPGSTYTYSDPNMITLGVLASRVAGKPLDVLVSERITTPLGMRDTGYNPPRGKLHRIAATEYQSDPPRGMVRGVVHDENAWSLDGVAGQAGIFTTAHDLAVLGQTVLNGGIYDGRRILRAETVESMLTDYNGTFPGNAHGLGFELDQRWYMGGLSSERSAGHTGYTGTSLVVDPKSRSVAVLLTNRVHPSRSWGSNNDARVRWAQSLAEGLSVPPRRGDDSWFASSRRPGAATLTTDPLESFRGVGTVSFDAFVDSQNDGDGVDPLSVEASADNGRTWRPLDLTAVGPGAPRDPQSSLAGAGHRAWWTVSAEVRGAGDKPLQLRWRYAPDARYIGRGVHVDGITVTQGEKVLFDGEDDPDRLDAQGWQPTER